MEGNVVTAAKWLGAALVLASAILVGGLHWVLSSVEWDRVSGTPSIEAAKPAGPAGPLPGDLEELAKSFRGPEPDTNARTRPTDQPRPLFADPTPRPNQDRSP